MLNRRVALFFLAAATAFPQAAKPLRVLFVGNSYTGRNDLPQMLTKLAASGPIAIETGRIVVGGATLQRHWQEGKALAAIQEGTWDFVVLQDHSLLGQTEVDPENPRVAPPGRFLEFARLFNAEIRKTKARTILYMTWARENFPEMQAALTEAYRTAARELSATLAPVGLATLNARAAYPAIHLYHPDHSHPSAQGTYLAACVFYAVLTGRSPAGLATDLIDENAADLQRIAWRTVESDPYSTHSRM